MQKAKVSQLIPRNIKAITKLAECQVSYVRLATNLDESDIDVTHRQTRADTLSSKIREGT